MAIHEVVFKFPNTEGYPLISLENEISSNQFDDQIVIPETEITVFSDFVPHACFAGKEYKLVSSSDRGFSGFELAKKFQEAWLADHPLHLQEEARQRGHGGFPHLHSLIREKETGKSLVLVWDC